MAYVGNKVSKLGVTRNINLVPRSENDKAIPSLGGNTGYLNQTFPNPFAGLVPGQALNAATISRGNLLRPYPHFTGGLAMNRLNLGSAYYNALEAAATKRYSNGMMFAVNYTLMKLEDAVNFFTDYDAEPYRDLQGDQRRHRLTITTLLDLPFGPGKPIGGGTHGFVAALIGGWQFNTIGEIQSGRPLGYNGVAIQLDPDVALPKSEQSFERWFDNSSTALNNPRPDGSFAWSVLGPNDYRVVKSRFHDVNEPTEPLWAFSLFKNTGNRRREHAADSRRDVQRVQREDLRRAEHGSAIGQLRDRGHGEPGQLPAHHPARSQVCDSEVAPAIAGSCNQDGLRHAGVRKPFQSITAVPPIPPSLNGQPRSLTPRRQFLLFLPSRAAPLQRHETICGDISPPFPRPIRPLHDHRLDG